jgi:hypothetical protein
MCSFSPLSAKPEASITSLIDSDKLNLVKAGIFPSVLSPLEFDHIARL